MDDFRSCRRGDDAVSTMSHQSLIPSWRSYWCLDPAFPICNYSSPLSLPLLLSPHCPLLSDFLWRCKSRYYLYTGGVGGHCSLYYHMQEIGGETNYFQHYRMLIDFRSSYIFSILSSCTRMDFYSWRRYAFKGPTSWIRKFLNTENYSGDPFSSSVCWHMGILPKYASSASWHLPYREIPDWVSMKPWE